MHCWENENIRFPQENSNVLMMQLTVFTQVTSHELVLQLYQTRIFPGGGPIYNNYPIS